MAAERLQSISRQLTGNFPQGMLEGEVAIITGGGQGIGRATALGFAREGAKVVVSDLDTVKGEEVVREIVSAGGQAIFVQGDVTSEAFPKKVVEATVKAYGKINHLVNNAGFTFDKMIHTMSDETFRLMIEVHNTAPFRLIREAAPYFRIKASGARENRSIVNVSSASGLHGNIGQANYSVAKAGVTGLTKTICKEWGPFGVRANTVAFGFISTRLTGPKEDGASVIVGGKTISIGVPSKVEPGKISKAGAGSLPDIPLGRAGTAEDAALAILFLASPMAAYISGHTLEVTGGRGI